MSWTARTQFLRSSLYAVAILALAITVMWGSAQFNTTTVEASGGSDAPSNHLTFTGTGTGAIPDDNPVGINVSFNVTGVTGPVSDVWISMNLTHSWVGDLNATLSAPNGTNHVLFGRTGTVSGGSAIGDSSNLGGLYKFIDNATGTNWWAAAAAGGDDDVIPAGDYRSTQAGPQPSASTSPATTITSAFASIPSANGTWTLNINDNATDDTGSISAATLAIAGSSAPPAGPGPDPYDFIGGPLADFTILTFPAAGGTVRWRSVQNDNPTTSTSPILDQPWGATASALVPSVGNYLGTPRSDFTVYRNETGSPGPNSYLSLENTGGTSAGMQKFQKWGDATTDFIGAEGDYNGDGVLDYTVVRDQSGTFQWYVLNSGSNTLTSFPYGDSANDIPLGGADYVGDSKHDPTVIRIGGSGQITFYVGTTTGTIAKSRNWGSFNTDFVVPGGDYDGDGKADFVVWRGFGAGTNGVWYILRQNDSTTATPWGIGAAATADRDRPLRGADYDGDGKDDLAVYRPSSGDFIVRRSIDMGTVIQNVQVPGNGNLPIGSFGVQ